MQKKKDVEMKEEIE
jgi:chromosome segregation ATPase